MQEHVVICDNLIKIYKARDLEVVALQGLDLEVRQGEMIALVGASGSGKSTLLNILGGLDTPTAGRAIVAAHDLSRLNEEQRPHYRNLIVGHLWQQSGRNLLPDLTIADNIQLPQLLKGVRASRYKQHTQSLLELVGLGTMGKKKPLQLSGGEQQRAALAVALANEPPLLLADEPTGELDSATTLEILAFMRQLNHALGITIIIVTHDATVASLVDRTLAIRDGRTSTETIRRQQPLPLDNLHGGSTTIGLSSQTHQESLFVDRTGMLQLPSEAATFFTESGRADVHVATDHVEIWPTGLFVPSPESAIHGKSAVIGLSLASHAETALVDRAGRLQLPKEALEQLSFNGRVRLSLVEQHIELWPVQTTLDTQRTY
ncbi:ABC transporter ATP-binding protein [Tengunoibacter tsumagoiensis]|uniref:ABC transporter ATP-binding protein n=1 Tax=Tengunoibacter tsumagoiensis TaxID=2014871 RepID=A0A402A1M6_9CHLR|nr:ABC transporter ATP-binding protein [Tengunoibacter tsumagoiensis]GCE12911.1 ABC transporter ATP-binding protein [Tengunoibacter tsumagoiensis]